MLLWPQSLASATVLMRAIILVAGKRSRRHRPQRVARGSPACRRAVGVVYSSAARGTAAAAHPRTAASASSTAAGPPCAGALRQRRKLTIIYRLQGSGFKFKARTEATPTFRSQRGGRAEGLDLTVHVASLMARCAK